MSKDFQYPCIVKEMSRDGSKIELWSCCRSDLRFRLFSELHPLSDLNLKDLNYLIRIHTKFELPSEYHVPFYDLVEVHS